MDKLLFAIVVVFGFAAIGFSLLTIVGMVQRVIKRREVRMLLQKYPNRIHTSVYLPIHSSLPKAKQREIETKAREMEAAGWRYLGFCPANPLSSLRFWGGAVTLHFIASDSSENVIKGRGAQEPVGGPEKGTGVDNAKHW